MVVHDEEFTELLAGADVAQRVLAWTDGDPTPTGDDTLESLIAGVRRRRPRSRPTGTPAS